MTEPSDAYRYTRYLYAHWRLIAGTCVIAMALALAFTLSRPARYAATCRVLVEPPMGGDVRGAFAVSSIYLESLKTYELFAASDSLFLRALDHFQLRQRYAGVPMESLKTGILKVKMLPYTRILEIQVTLHDPKIAHALALFLAQETVKMNRTINSEGDAELVQDLENQDKDARARMQSSESALTKMVAQEPIDGLQRELRAAGDLRSTLQRQLLSTEQDTSDAADAGAAARAAMLRKQLAQVEQDITAKEDLLAQRTAQRSRLDAERTASQEAYTAVENHLRQVRSDAGARGERLRIIDPGIIPERPTSPNVPLAVFAALLLGILAPVIYLTLSLSYHTQRSSVRRTTLRVAGTGSDE